MMKKVLAVLVCLVAGISTNATVFVSGIITANTTWTKVNSPYIVNGNLTVDSGVTLTIEPGVEVRVDSSYFFAMNGRLLAEGTVTDTIRFTSNKTAPTRKAWSGITFSLQSVDTSKIKYCVFEYGNRLINATGAKMKIYNSIFRRGTVAIQINGKPNYQYKDYYLINKCLVTESDTGLYDTGAEQPGSKITENEFSYNTIGMREENERGLRDFNYNDFNYNVTGYSSTGGQFGCRINTFKGNSQYGVYVNCVVPDDISYISESKFMYNATAIYINNARYGSIYMNQLAYNGIGIHDNYSYTGTNLPRGLVQMFSNCYHKNSFYNFKEDGRYSVNTNGDWWGSNSTSNIDSFIYDFNDNSSSALINYSNRATTAGGCVSIPPPPPCDDPDSLNIHSVSSTSAIVSWAAVPGAPSYEYYVTRTPSTPPTMGTVTTNTSVSLTGLTPGTTYTFCVRTRCSAAPFVSEWMCDTFTTTTVTGIAQMAGTKTLNIHPNPNNGIFTIDIPRSVTGGMLTVSNMYGQVVKQEIITSTAGLQTDLSNAAKGIYMIQIKNGEDTYRAKVVVQ